MYRLIPFCAVIPFCLVSDVVADGLTSLTDNRVRYQISAEHHVTLQRGNLTAIIVDNAAIDIAELPGHRAGYNGVASLTHRLQKQNLFVPGIAGLNFEHIHDGTKRGLVEKFEPRKFPMQLRVIDESTVEVYQPPTGNWQLESCGRYRLLDNDVIEYTFECIPRKEGYQHDYIGLFWASYIHQPKEKEIHFQGRPKGSSDTATWIRGVTPQHGIDSTHSPAEESLPRVDKDFPLTLVNHPSRYEYTEPWYYGVSHDMAFVQMFRREDKIWMAQSPSGGGNGNPAWDFQWFIREPKTDTAYGFQMRAAYVPFASRQQVTASVRDLLLN